MGPQSIILGSSLFLIYINDLCQMSLQNGKLFTYADETALVLNAICIKYACWLRENRPTLNLSKSTFLQFTLPHNKQENVSIKLYSCNPPHSSDCSYLTVTKSANVKYRGDA